VALSPGWQQGTNCYTPRATEAKGHFLALWGEFFSLLAREGRGGGGSGGGGAMVVLGPQNKRMPE
jgi:hypothetical protein